MRGPPTAGGMRRLPTPVRGSSGTEPAKLPGPSEVAVAVLLFALATLILSYPLAFAPASLSRLDNGDARLNAWAMSWVSHQLVTDPLALFDANTFYPLQKTLAFSEHLTLLGALALPLLSLTDDLVLTNNLLLLFSMFATALGMYLLGFTLTRNHYAALLAGLLFSFAPFRFNRLPHIQIQLYAFIPLMLAGLHLFLLTRRRRWLTLAAGAFVLQALAGTYLGAIAAIGLAVAMVTLIPTASLSWRDLSRLAVAFGVSGLVLVPFALPYLWVHHELGVEWELAGLGSLSATPEAYLSSSSHLYRVLTESITSPEGRTDYLFPGFTLLVLGAIGAASLLKRKGGRPTALCYSVIFVVGVVLSVGPMTPVHPFLYENVVFFRGLRALTRFGLLPLLSLSVFSAIGAATLLDRLGSIGSKRVLALALGVFFALESTAIPYRLEPHRDEPPEVYRWLKDQAPGPFVELPFKVVDTRYMFWARHHGFRKTLNGDSGFIPLSHQWMKVVLGRFPSPDAIALLQRLEVRYVVLHLGAFRPRALPRLLNGLKENNGRLIPIRDFGSQVVYEVTPLGVEMGRARAGEETLVARAGEETLAARAGEETLAARAGSDHHVLFDGSSSEAVSGESSELEVDVTLEQASTIRGLRLHYGPVPRVPVDRVELVIDDASGSHVAWTSAKDWPAVTELVVGLLETPLDGTQTIAIDPLRTAKFRLRLRGIDGQPPDVTELVILGDSRER